MKDAARLDDWAKDVAPSTELRHWYGHDPAKFDEFRRRYLKELQAPEPAAALARLRDLAARRPVRLLTATRDLAISNAAVLAELLAPKSLPDDRSLTGRRTPQRVKDDPAPP
jgi:uncharacterized protein YeaO (DUF488 family)